jgi:hypothetical protein
LHPGRGAKAKNRKGAAALHQLARKLETAERPTPKRSSFQSWLLWDKRDMAG